MFQWLSFTTTTTTIFASTQNARWQPHYLFERHVTLIYKSFQTFMLLSFISRMCNIVYIYIYITPTANQFQCRARKGSRDTQHTLDRDLQTIPQTGMRDKCIYAIVLCATNISRFCHVLMGSTAHNLLERASSVSAMFVSNQSLSLLLETGGVFFARAFSTNV